jgi:uncharacterized protein YndB with AHSA1/START domain
MIAGEASEGMKRNKTTMELDGDRSIVITRTFNAPPRIVFDAWTRADLVKRWWAPRSRGVSMASCEADPRPGGKYRYVLRLPTGDEVAFSGEYSELLPFSRIVYTQVFEPAAEGGAAIVTITLQEVEGKTRLTSREVYPSAEVRDAVLASGMEGGMRETMDQLDELVHSLDGSSSK